MITWSKKTYSSYGGNPLGQVPSPCAPYCPLNGQNLTILGSIKVHLKTDVMKITNQLWDQHLALFKTSIMPQDQTKWLLWIFTYMINWSKNTYSYHGGNPLGQDASPWAPFCPLNWQNLALLYSKHVHFKSYVIKIAYYIQDKHLAMFETSILPHEKIK